MLLCALAQVAVDSSSVSAACAAGALIIVIGDKFWGRKRERKANDDSRDLLLQINQRQADCPGAHQRLADSQANLVESVNKLVEVQRSEMEVTKLRHEMLMENFKTVHRRLDDLKK